MAKQMAETKDKEVEDKIKKITVDLEIKTKEEVEKIIEEFEKKFEGQKLKNKDLEEEVAKWNDIIDMLREEVKAKDVEIETINNQSILANSLKETYKTFFNDAREFTHQSELVFKMNDPKANSFIKHYVENKLKLPNLKKLEFNWVKEKDEYLNSFLSDCWPQSLQIFSFNDRSTFHISLSSYIPSLSKCLPAVTTQVYFVYTDIESSGDLSTLVKASRNSLNLVVRSCEVHTDDKCNFGEEEYNTKSISFGHYLGENICKWNGTDRFKNIIEGISKSNFKKRLETIGINESNVSKANAEACLSRFGCNDIQIKVGYEEVM